MTTATATTARRRSRLRAARSPAGPLLIPPGSLRPPSSFRRRQHQRASRRRQRQLAWSSPSARRRAPTPTATRATATRTAAAIRATATAPRCGVEASSPLAHRPRGESLQPSIGATGCVGLLREVWPVPSPSTKVCDPSRANASPHSLDSSPMIAHGRSFSFGDGLGIEMAGDGLQRARRRAKQAASSRCALS